MGLAIRKTHLLDYATLMRKARACMQRTRNLNAIVAMITSKLGKKCTKKVAERVIGALVIEFGAPPTSSADTNDNKPRAPA